MSPAALGLSERVRQRLAACVAPGQTLTVAFSGGLDSTVLLHLLAELAPALGVGLRAAHVHHGLQHVAADWPAHCAGVCAALSVPFESLSVRVPKGGQGLESAARSARYAALRGLGGDWLALAHHRGDQAETVLHRLVRGAGVAGAAGMRAQDARGGPPFLLRPLLDEPRAGLLAWAQARGLTWIEDPSNTDTHFSRNYLRHTILPGLSARFPGAEAALARAAGHFAEAAELLDGIAQADWGQVRLGACAALDALRALPDARLRNLLRARLMARDWPTPETVQLDEALRLLHTAQQPWRARLGHWALCAQDGQVWIEPAALPPAPGPALWQGEAAIEWGALRLGFVAASGPSAWALTPGALMLLPRQGGERLQPDPRRPGRDLKTLAREAGLPPWLRDHVPVLWQAERPVAYAGFVDHRLRTRDGASGWHLDWQTSPPSF